MAISEGIEVDLLVTCLHDNAIQESGGLAIEARCMNLAVLSTCCCEALLSEDKDVDIQAYLNGRKITDAQKVGVTEGQHDSATSREEYDILDGSGERQRLNDLQAGNL